jgi:hypothetical protein
VEALLKKRSGRSRRRLDIMTGESVECAPI